MSVGFAGFSRQAVPFSIRKQLFSPLDRSLVENGRHRTATLMLVTDSSCCSCSLAGPASSSPPPLRRRVDIRSDYKSSAGDAARRCTWVRQICMYMILVSCFCAANAIGHMKQRAGVGWCVPGTALQSSTAASRFGNAGGTGDTATYLPDRTTSINPKSTAVCISTSPIKKSRYQGRYDRRRYIHIAYLGKIHIST